MVLYRYVYKPMWCVRVFMCVLEWKWNCVKMCMCVGMCCREFIKWGCARICVSSSSRTYSRKCRLRVAVSKNQQLFPVFLKCTFFVLRRSKSGENVSASFKAINGKRFKKINIALKNRFPITGITVVCWLDCRLLFAASVFMKNDPRRRPRRDWSIRHTRFWNQGKRIKINKYI